MTTWPHLAASSLRRVTAACVVAVLAALAGAGAASAATASASPSPSATSAAKVVKYYVVSTGYQGKPEYLFEIAKRLLGSGFLDTKLFDLNKGRKELDGLTVSSPSVLKPGWYLELPSNARGDGIVTGVIPSYVAPPTGLPVEYYVVANTYEGKPQYPFEIAQRFLGNGFLDAQIFDLNKGRREPDGLTVSNPAVIKPGWYLEMPAGAKGDGLVLAPIPRYSIQALPSPTKPAAAPTPAPARSGQPSIVILLIIVLGNLLIIGGIWWGVRHRYFARMGRAFSRGRHDAAPGDEAAAWTIDRVLRTLATACARAERPLPGIGAVVVGADTLSLRLSGPDEQPPPGWTAEHQGRTWSAPLRLLQSAPVDDSLEAPYPRLVSVGDSSQGRVLLNLAEARGLISLDGDSRLIRSLAADWAAGLAGSPWARGTTVLRIGFAHEPDVADLDGVKTAASLDEAAQLLEEADGGVLMLAHAPSGSEIERVGALAADPERNWSVLVLGSTRNASWRLTAEVSGTLETGLLGEPIRLPGRARHLEPA